MVYKQITPYERDTVPRLQRPTRNGYYGLGITKAAADAMPALVRQHIRDYISAKGGHAAEFTEKRVANLREVIRNVEKARTENRELGRNVRPDLSKLFSD